MNRATSRRRFLGAGGSVFISVLSGCSTPSNTETDTEILSANVPSEKLSQNGWRMTADRTEHVFEKNYLAGALTVSANQRTVIYEDKQLENTVKKRTLGNIDTALKTFFATRVILNPDLESLPFGLGINEIVNDTITNAKGAFEDQLRNAGLTDIAETGGSEVDINTGERADMTSYRAKYEYESISVPVPEADDIVISGGSLSISGLLAVWPHENSILVAGGAFPADDFEKSADTDVTEAIEVSVTIDLGLRPSRYHQEILGFIISTK